MEKKRIYFKLGGHASVFSDPAAKLKVTRNVPGSTENPGSKPTASAKANGHIIEISKEEFDKMMSEITPAEKKAAYEEQGIPYTEEKKAKKAPKKKDDDDDEEDDDDDSDDDDDEDEDDEREALLEKLKGIKMTPTKRKEIQALETPELKAFIEAEEKK